VATPPGTPVVRATSPPLCGLTHYLSSPVVRAYPLPLFPGNPSCANGYILNEVMRGLWQQPDAVVATDCGAVSNLNGPPVNAPDRTMAVAYAVNNGTDIELGSTEFLAHLKEAVDRNLTTEATVTESVRRVFAQWFSAGRFDSLEDFAYAHIGPDQVG